MLSLELVRCVGAPKRGSKQHSVVGCNNAMLLPFHESLIKKLGNGVEQVKRRLRVRLTAAWQHLIRAETKSDWSLTPPGNAHLLE